MGAVGALVGWQAGGDGGAGGSNGAAWKLFRSRQSGNGTSLWRAESCLARKLGRATPVPRTYGPCAAQNHCLHAVRHAMGGSNAAAPSSLPLVLDAAASGGLARLPPQLGERA